MFGQQRPRWTGWRGIPEFPTLPWSDEDRPPQINFARLDVAPNAGYMLPSNFGLCVLNQLSVERKLLRTQTYNSMFMRPAVVHPIKPLPVLPAQSITGVSRDSNGNPLGGCTCSLLRVVNTGSTPLFVHVDTTVSDGSGNYSFRASAGFLYRVTFDLAGSPDRAGITTKTLQGV